MKLNFIGWLAFLLVAIPAWADTQALSKAPTVRLISMHNPALYAGIQLGDVLQRTMKVSVDASDALDESRLPLKGLQRQGIELRQLSVHSEVQQGQKIYRLVFDYQVFASPGRPLQLQLPAEQVSFNSGAQIALPAWRFWLMSQLPDRLQAVKSSVIAQYRPSLLALQTSQLGFALSGFFALLGGILLLYRNADWAWLPRMNGHFAQAYRRLKRLPETPEGQKQATLLMQHAFNQHFGLQMLGQQVSVFVQQQPAFKALTADIQQFFVQANAVLYGGPLPAIHDYLQQCKTLTRQLRACERRL